MQKLQQERLLVAILAVSKAEFILEWIIDHFKKQWDTGLSPSVSQAVRFSLVAMANRVARWCLDLCEEFGGLEECPIVRTFRDLRVTPIFAGTNEIMKEIIAKSLNLL